MTSHPFDVVVRHVDGTARTVFSHAELFTTAREALKLADRISDGGEGASASPPKEVAIECGGRLELSIAVTPGQPLYDKRR